MPAIIFFTYRWLFLTPVAVILMAALILLPIIIDAGFDPTGLRLS